MSLSVIGAGFGRTGTLSLKNALEQLGLGPCYHMMEVHKRPAHDHLWLDAVEGRPVDWDALFAGYRSSCDWPQCSFWRELMDHFPQARVILTVRDEALWHRSITRTIFQSLAREPDPRDADAVAHRKMTRALIYERTFGGRWRDEDHVRRVYREHVARVRRDVPPERLLVYDVAEGWAPLCGFLGLPVPDVPFPKVNSTAEFRSRMKAQAS